MGKAISLYTKHVMQSHDHTNRSTHFFLSFFLWGSGWGGAQACLGEGIFFLFFLGGGGGGGGAGFFRGRDFFSFSFFFFGGGGVGKGLVWACLEEGMLLYPRPPHTLTYQKDTIFYYLYSSLAQINHFYYLGEGIFFLFFRGGGGGDACGLV